MIVLAEMPELNVLLRGNRLEIVADVDLAGLLRLKAILGKYEEILALIEQSPSSVDETKQPIPRGEVTVRSFRRGLISEKIVPRAAAPNTDEPASKSCRLDTPSSGGEG